MLSIFQRMVLAMLVLGITVTSHANSDDVVDFLVDYEQAIREQDNGKVAGMLADDVAVQVSMLTGNEAPTVISLSRDEFLQQQRLLWRFASAHSFTIKKPDIRKAADEGWEVSFQMQEEYALFQTSLNRENSVRLRLVRRGDELVIQEIRTRSREW
ncbi:hypothetical protein MWU49_10840 [Alcanivorax sp. S6407]|uniref:hypothetical protein n=1 Tax=Alcanivorax sp. S6407 TaxID=2926424 RepID=UPI001FF6EDCD|nr:hypothetical protein [Alcanivorax sp. S6407]MCK0154200.1 hypothetical protein [Alcanivorax sp. S6407]